MTKKWIDVNERLPEVGDWANIIVHHAASHTYSLLSKIGYNNLPEKEVVCAQLRYVEQGYGYWEQGQLASGHALKSFDNVTHWQPLPELFDE